MSSRAQLSEASSDADIIAAVDTWIALLGTDDYQTAYGSTAHVPKSGWTPEFMRQVIKRYGDAEPGQRVTIAGRPTDVTQREEVHRYSSPQPDGLGHVWYHLNLNGLASDLTATFDIWSKTDRLVLALNDIHAM